MDINVAIFFGAVAIGIPLAVYACLVNRMCMYAVFGMLIFSTLMVDWSMTFVSREMYKTATRGFEVHLMDLLAVVLFLSMLFRSNEYRFTLRVPLLIPFLVLLGISVISWVSHGVYSFPNFLLPEVVRELPQFEVGLYPLFEMSKMVRGFFIYWICLHFVKDQTSLRVLIGVLVLIVIWCTGEALYSRYIQGEHRVIVMGLHPNDFNVYIGMIGMMIFPLAFARKASLLKSVSIWTVMLFTLLCIVLTVSRSSLAGFVLGFFIAYVLCITRIPLMRTVLISAVVACLSMVLFGRSIDTLLERFTYTQHVASVDMRDTLNQSAVLMAKEYWFGVGLGNYSVYNMKKYSAITQAEYGNIAHNIWYLTLGELGYLGLLALICLWLRYYQVLLVGLVHSWYQKKETVFLLLVGALCSSVVLQFQNMYHFSYRQTSVYFLMHIIFAVSVRMYLDQRKSQPKTVVEVQAIQV